jgi:chorismate mutase
MYISRSVNDTAETFQNTTLLQMTKLSNSVSRRLRMQKAVARIKKKKIIKTQCSGGTPYCIAIFGLVKKN